MEYYDARIIEGCFVYSYTVEPPTRKTEQKTEPAPMPKKNLRRERKRAALRKREMLKFFLLLLVPFALILDVVTYLVNQTALFVWSVFCGPRSVRKEAASFLCAMSCFCLASAVLLML